MADFYLGTILPVAFKFAPVDWALCNGQSLKVSDYPELFSLLGSTYGGDGHSYFNLPDLCGRFPIGSGKSQGNPYSPLPTYKEGAHGGKTEVSLGIENMPVHTHPATVKMTGSSVAFLKVSKDDATTSVPTQGMLPAALKAVDDSGSGNHQTVFGYAQASSNVAYLPAISFPDLSLEVSSDSIGGNRPFNIMNPYLSVNFIISLRGEYPQQNTV